MDCDEDNEETNESRQTGTNEVLLIINYFSYIRQQRQQAQI